MNKLTNEQIHKQLCEHYNTTDVFYNEDKKTWYILDENGEREVNMETYDKPKNKQDEIPPLELLYIVMYGNRNIGEVDQAYELLKRYLKGLLEEKDDNQ